MCTYDVHVCICMCVVCVVSVVVCVFVVSECDSGYRYVVRMICDAHILYVCVCRV